MATTSYTARLGVQAWPDRSTSWRWEPVALLGAALLMAVGAGFGAATMLMGGARLTEAAQRTAMLTGKYSRLHEADFTETLFPIAEGIGSLGEASGFPATCGVVISGIDASGPAPQVKWQRVHGTCAASRIGGDEAVQLSSGAGHGGAVVAVEVFSSALPSMVADRDGYAVAFATPAGGHLPSIAAGQR